MPGVEAGLPEERGLLVADDAAHRDARRARRSRRRSAPRRPLDGRTSGRAADGHAEQRRPARRPTPGGRCRAASCGWRWSGRWRARRPPVRFHTTQVSMVPRARSGPAGTPPSVQQPRHLGGREVGVEHQPGALAHERQVAGGGQLVAAVGGAPVLPHDGPVQRAGRCERFHATTVSRWLVMPMAATGSSSAGAQLAQRGPHRVPDLVGVVLDPARPGEVLGELPVGPGLGRAPASSTARARTPVVPASMAMTIGHGGAERTPAPGRQRGRLARGCWRSCALVGGRLGPGVGARTGRPRRPVADVAPGVGLRRGWVGPTDRRVPPELHHDDGDAEVEQRRPASTPTSDADAGSGPARRCEKASGGDDGVEGERHQQPLPRHRPAGPTPSPRSAPPSAIPAVVA